MLRFFLHTNKIDYLPNEIQPYILLQEECIIIKLSNNTSITDDEISQIGYLLSNYFSIHISLLSSLPSIKDVLQNNKNKTKHFKVLTIGPRPSFKTSWCSNVIDLFSRINIKIDRVEKFARYLLPLSFDNYDSLFDKMTESIYSNYYFESTIDNFTNTDLDTIQLSEIFDSFQQKKEDTYYIDINDLERLNEEMGLSLDKQDIEYYQSIFKNKKVTNVELYDVSQSNSEHSRHWFFNGNYNIYLKNHEFNRYELKTRDTVSLMQKIKSTNNIVPNNSIIAFKDNSSAIEGYQVDHIYPDENHQYVINYEKLHPTHTAETHNFPTGICPFPGAATGTGGRIRDQISIGRGGKFVSGYVGYSVGQLFSDSDYPFKKPEEILIEASNGASDYGNKIGEPVTLGYTRSFGSNTLPFKNSRYEYVKPIMYSGGIGMIKQCNVKKGGTELGHLVVRVGGPAYNIGLGGGSASSRNQDTQNKALDFNAVQRGDPQMENKAARFIEICSNMDDNPIISVHDQGSGGMGNVTKEIMSPMGGIVTLNKVNLGEPDLSSNVIWNAEYQEQFTILINHRDINLIKKIAKRENVKLEFVGVITNSGRISVNNTNDAIEKVVDFDLKPVLDIIPTKKYDLYQETNLLKENDIIFQKPSSTDLLLFESNLEKILTNINVGSKRFLTNKVDRSVSGLIAQQQCVGPFHIPLSNFSVTSLGFLDTKGTVASIGEQPIKGIMNNISGVEMSIGEMLTNLMFCKISSFNEIKCLGNWMWSPKLSGQGYLLYEAANHCSYMLKKLGIGIDGGKDSLSMNTKFNDNIVVSPNTFVISSYASCDNILCKATPNIKGPDHAIIFIDLGHGNYRLGGSQYCQNIDNLNYECPRFEKIETFPIIFKLVQLFLSEGKILAGHDRSDGGLITTLIEMCISSPYGVKLDIEEDINWLSYLYNEELGLVIEVLPQHLSEILATISNYCPCSFIGTTIPERKFILKYNHEVLMNHPTKILWSAWESSSFKLERKQCNHECVKSEEASICHRKEPYFNISDTLIEKINNLEKQLINSPCKKKNFLNYTVGIIREEGSNGDKEMAAAFLSVGFEVYDITMNDIIRTKGEIIHQFNGIAFVGGFSFSDALGSSIGWASTILFNKEIKKEFDNFYNNVTKFSIGVCNGCQLMSLLGYIPEVRLIENKSKRFESRCVQVKIYKNSNNIFLKDMEDTFFNIWSAHGEGQFEIKDPKLLDNIENIYLKENKKPNLFPIRYVDDDGKYTEKYPFNPNGSIKGVAAVSSENGRHLAIMPHPERCFLKWQLPYIPDEYNRKLNTHTPWMQLFRNAYHFCDKMYNIITPESNV